MHGCAMDACSNPVQIILPPDDVTGPDATGEWTDSDEPLEYLSLELVNHLPAATIQRLSASVRAQQGAADQAKAFRLEAQESRQAHQRSEVG
mmetsp:Transcript_119816/g.274460  ORF Transcript_119816/g.274460 Transcript_119816/m.274460 type:complete len:92 (-) Transcript_119816:682-957(-)